MITELNKILEARSIGEAKPGFATVNTQAVNTKAEVVNALHAFGSCTGWITITDKVISITQARQIDDALLEGRMPLSGEMVNGNQSLHLRQAPKGWLLTKIEASETGDMVVFEERFINKEKGGPKLCYETFWKLRSDGSEIETYQPWISRFAGFEKEANDESA